VTNERKEGSSLPGLDTYRQIIRSSGNPLSETQSVNSPDSANRPESTDPGPPAKNGGANPAEPTDPESLSSCVLGQVKAKDPQAWERMVKLYGPMIYRWARRAGLQSADSADVVQEVFRAVALYIAEFEAERMAEGFRAWLWTITKNTLTDHFRKQSGAPGSGDDAFEATVAHEPDFPEPDDLQAPSPDVGMVHRVLHNIRPDFDDTTWEAFWQMTVENRTSAEAAESLSMSKSAVRQAKYRILKRLREELTGA
jgi:RNA polymerase sigma-70 factor, ECF subfamily